MLRTQHSVLHRMTGFRPLNLGLTCFFPGGYELSVPCPWLIMSDGNDVSMIYSVGNMPGIASFHPWLPRKDVIRVTRHAIVSI